MLARTLLHARSRLTAAPYACCPIVVTLVCYASARCSVSHAARLHARPALSNRVPLLTPPPNRRQIMLGIASRAASGGLPAQSSVPYPRTARRALAGALRGSAHIPVCGPRLPCRSGPSCAPSAAGPSVCPWLRAAAPPLRRKRSARCAAPRLRFFGRRRRLRAVALRIAAALAARAGPRPVSPRPGPPAAGLRPVPSGACMALSAAASLVSGCARPCCVRAAAPPAALAPQPPGAGGDRVRSGPRRAKKIRNPVKRLRKYLWTIHANLWYAQTAKIKHTSRGGVSCNEYIRLRRKKATGSYSGPQNARLLRRSLHRTVTDAVTHDTHAALRRYGYGNSM